MPDTLPSGHGAQGTVATPKQQPTCVDIRGAPRWHQGQFFKALDSIHLIWLAYANRQQPLQPAKPFIARQQFTLPLPFRFVCVYLHNSHWILYPFSSVIILAHTHTQIYTTVQRRRTIKGNRNYTDWEVVTMQALAIKYKFQIPQTRLILLPRHCALWFQNLMIML